MKGTEGTEGEPVVADQIIVYPSTFQVGKWSRSKTNKTQLDVRCSQWVLGAALTSATNFLL